MSAIARQKLCDHFTRGAQMPRQSCSLRVAIPNVQNSALNLRIKLTLHNFSSNIPGLSSIMSLEVSQVKAMDCAKKKHGTGPTPVSEFSKKHSRLFLQVVMPLTPGSSTLPPAGKVRTMHHCQELLSFSPYGRAICFRFRVANRDVWSATSQLLQSAKQECRTPAQVVQQIRLCDFCALDQISLKTDLCPAVSHPTGLVLGVISSM